MSHAYKASIARGWGQELADAGLEESAFRSLSPGDCEHFLGLTAPSRWVEGSVFDRLFLCLAPTVNDERLQKFSANAVVRGFYPSLAPAAAALFRVFGASPKTALTHWSIGADVAHRGLQYEFTVTNATTGTFAIRWPTRLDAGASWGFVYRGVLLGFLQAFRMTAAISPPQWSTPATCRYQISW